MGEEEEKCFSKMVENLRDLSRIVGVPGFVELSEAAKRSFIDCVLIAVLTCFPKLEPILAMDRVLDGTLGHGPVDYCVIFKKNFLLITKVCCS